MKTEIRLEKEPDHPAVFKLIKEAFKNEEYSDHSEPFLVERLRRSKAFIPELSLVAVADNQVVGHILLTKIRIKNNKQSFDSLALAPVSVLPEFQKQGIGGLLIRTAHKKAAELGYRSVILLGHTDYYPRFGYTEARKFGISLPFDVPSENCMAVELTDRGLAGVNGMVDYPKEFYE